MALADVWVWVKALFGVYPQTLTQAGSGWVGTEFIFNSRDVTPGRPLVITHKITGETFAVVLVDDLEMLTERAGMHLNKNPEVEAFVWKPKK